MKKTMIDNKNASVFNRWATGVLLVSSALCVVNAQADTNKLKWAGNGHFYQRFDRAFTWNDAKTYCENLSGHLATITSEQENAFIGTKIMPTNSVDYYFLGANDAQLEGTWKWITGERWDYNHFYNGQPENRDTEDYLVINSYSYYDYSWYDQYDSNTQTKGFVCEWSFNNVVASTALPDTNGNRSADLAVLYVDYKTSKHSVHIRDGSSKKILKTMAFETNDRPPLGVVALADINGNGKPEIAVLYIDTESSAPRVGIKDAATGVTLKDFAVLGLNYTPKNITSTVDVNGNKSSEITMLGVDGANGKSRSETRDSKTAAIINFAVF
ncbi:C-type lectin domain-containing protein [Crenothrix polyspora]|uniref:C-type lectin domain-containing protein n=1 Tax=Crenothrix polyspora TaxID=360316 RepID=A0A1R4H6N4_9GAMM|nr:C-type lectin domain-containing protein [Crenothrix polyspora]SJM91912.1 exported hypothetical protein [Crenothrix polyspora]